MSNDWTYLYVIEHPNGFYKVGKANDPRQRRHSIQSGSPYELELKHAVKYMKASSLLDERDFESVVHESLKEYNTRGEWFSADLVEVIHHIVSCMSDAGITHDLERYEEIESRKKALNKTRFVR